MTEAEKKPTEPKEASVMSDLSAPDEKSTSPVIHKGDTISAGNPAYVHSGGIIQRRSPWYSSLAAIKYLNTLSRDDDVRVRDSDRATSIFLLISASLTVVSLVIPQLEPHRVAFILVCDVLVGVLLVFYVANRFGIINTLSPRQAILAWQLLLGASFLGIFLTLNFALFVALVASQQSYTTAPAAPAVQSKTR